jgi:hypothetical protein
MKSLVTGAIGRDNPKDKRPFPLDLPIAESSHLQGKLNAPVAQLDRASAFEAQQPVPTPPSFHMSFQYFQQLGESASRSMLSPTPRIDRVLAQFWHSSVG